MAKSATPSARENRTIYRALRILEARFKVPNINISSPASGRDYLRLRFAGLEREELHALWLTTQNTLIDVESLFIGTLTQTSVYPRELVKAALAANASAVVLAHNHPSGLATPSNADIALTAICKNALATVDIALLDHFVVTTSDVTSLAEAGYV